MNASLIDIEAAPLVDRASERTPIVVTGQASLSRFVINRRSSVSFCLPETETETGAAAVWKYSSERERRRFVSSSVPSNASIELRNVHATTN